MAASRETGAVRRVRRPKDKEQLLDQLVKQGPFDDMRDVLVFAAALGWYEQRRIPLGAGASGETIRWEVVANRRGTEALVNMIAANVAGDPTILSSDHFEQRLSIFEEYANGGLEILGSVLAAAPRPSTDVILDLVQKALRPRRRDDGPDLSEDASGLQW